MLTIPLVRESDSSDERIREAFRDIKATLRVPLVSQIFQAWATVPRFLDYTWRRLRPNVLAWNFVEQARNIEALAERIVSAWPGGDHVAALRESNVSEADVLRMREISSMFADLDPKLLAIAHAVRLALSGTQIGGGGASGRQPAGDIERLSRDNRGLSVPLVEDRDASQRVRTVLEDLKTSLGLSLVPNDYRAIAAFPDWLEVWWRDCKTSLGAPRYAALLREVDQAGINAARALPYRLNLADELLLRSEVSAEDRARIARITEAFCEMMPGVVINMAVAQRGLGQTTGT
jgi:Halocarboxylic acid dehydrogenase DehI